MPWYALRNGSRTLLSCMKSFKVICISQVRTNVSKDATLYSHDRRTFFRLVGLASASQCVFWIYLAHFQYTKEKLISSAVRGKEINVSSSRNTWKIVSFLEERPLSIAVFAVSVGVFFSVTGWIFCLRSINRLVLIKGGSSVKVVTHTPLGGTRSFITSLSDMSCVNSRLDKSSSISLKVKGHKFFFLLDKEGTFLQPTLFDNTVGLKRVFQ